MNIGLHHFLHNHPIEHHPTFCKFIDRTIYGVGLFGVAIIIPQILKIWIEKQTDGISVTTWMGFLVSSVFWLLYGVIHKQKPIIITNIAAILAHLSVIIGILLFR